MATIRISINPEDPIESIVYAAGAATVTKNIEVTVNQAAVVTDASSTVTPRPISRKEVILALYNVILGLQRDSSITGFSDF
jgi:hypothetical protein